MKKNNLYLVIGVPFIFILACSVKKTTEFNQSNNDTCSYCHLETFRIQTTGNDQSSNLVIDYPVAINFFNTARFIFKYERINYDTVLKVLNVKLTDSRDLIYSLTEQYNYYKIDIEPRIVKEQVMIIDSLTNKTFITFIDHSNTYTIDIRPFKQNDGVLLFKPGKLPVFWTMKRDEKSCQDYRIFPKWYFSCPN